MNFNKPITRAISNNIPNGWIPLDVKIITSPVASVPFYGITGEYAKEAYVLVDIVPTTTATLYLRVGTPGAQSGGSDYAYRAQSNDFGGTDRGYTSAGAAQVPLNNSAVPLTAGTGAAAGGYSGTVEAFNLNSNFNAKAFLFEGCYRIDPGSVSDYNSVYGGRAYYQSLVPVQSVFFLPSTGLIARGTIYRYGVLKPR